jgi:2-phospho-L-lactate guanylyltransferase
VPTPPAPSPPESWSIVVPVKALHRAKSRLDGFAARRRADLALAMALDTVAAARTATGVAAVLVVTDDRRAGDSLRELGVELVADVPNAGLNPALVHATGVAAHLRPQYALAALSADLPALTPGQLETALAAASPYPSAFVADAGGAGTTLLCVRRPGELRPRFGPGSAGRHREAGAVRLDLDGIGGLRRDVDTAADLASAERLGVGPHTAHVLHAMGR